MGDVIFLDQEQDQIVEVAKRLLNSAQQNDVSCIILTEVDAEGNIAYSRAGAILSGVDALKLVGSMEHHKQYILRKLDEVMALATEFNENEDEDEDEEGTE